MRFIRIENLTKLLVTPPRDNCPLNRRNIGLNLLISPINRVLIPQHRLRRDRPTRGRFKIGNIRSHELLQTMCVSLYLSSSHSTQCRHTPTRIQGRTGDRSSGLRVNMSMDRLQGSRSVHTTLDLGDLTRSTGLQTTSIIAPTCKIRRLLKLSHLITPLNKAPGRIKSDPGRR